ncbi:MAG: hypothetical protein GXP25_15585 [Planctomycetes bacterium]|nr:hypothetical protein [Planctomycetota bacterium]
MIKLLIRKGLITEKEASELKAELETGPQTKEIDKKIEDAIAKWKKESAAPAGSVPLRLGVPPAGEGEPGVNLGLQYRVMYNGSNIPGLDGSTFSDPEGYDFFRQRFRITLDVKPVEKAGGYAQLEFRNAWGVGPGNNGVGWPANVAFNRLSARGIRYGYLYYLPGDKHNVSAGILPLSDQVGDTLFSSDWDFNVGGVNYTGTLHNIEYRAAYVRLVDTLGTGVDREGHFYIFDANVPINGVTLGAHAYYLDKDSNSLVQGFEGQEADEGWYSVTASTEISEVDLNGFFMVNTGRLESDAHTGFAAKGEASVPVGEAKLSVLGIYSSGDPEGRQLKRAFVTPESLLGTEGYWQYTHIFSANGPSDVNDLAVDMGNRGQGLVTLQSKLDFPITDWASGQLETGWFRASHRRNFGENMGWEFGGMVTFQLTEYLALEVGAAGAFLGNQFDYEERDIYEAFSRFQLEF